MKVISYCRVSTDKQDLDRQRMLAREFCKAREYELIRYIVDKQSGTKADRDGLNELLTLTSEDCDLVIVSEISRITREEEFQTIFLRIDTLRHNGVSICFMDDPDNIYTPDKAISLVQFIMLAVKAQGAREELLKIRDRMKSGRESKLKINPMMVTTSQVPFGYEKYDNPDYIKSVTPKSLLRVNESERLAIRFCYDMACSGKSCQRIADWLNANGHEHNNNKGKKLWQATEIARLLRNRLYIGERRIEGVTHYIEPFVSVEVFETAGRCISQNRCIIAKDEHFNPLKGLLFCGECGLPMSVKKVWHGYLSCYCLYNAYRTRNLNRELTRCNNNTAILEQICDVIFKACIDRIKSDEYYGHTQLTLADYQKQIKAIKSEIYKKRHEISKTSREIDMILSRLNALTDEILIKIIEKEYQKLRKQKEAQEAEFLRLDKLHDELYDKMRQLEIDIQIDPEMSIYERAEFYNRIIKRIEWKGTKFQRWGMLIIEFKNGDKVEFKITKQAPKN